jgi:hypothetical protein
MENHSSNNNNNNNNNISDIVGSNDHNNPNYSVIDILNQESNNSRSRSNSSVSDIDSKKFELLDETNGLFIDNNNNNNNNNEIPYYISKNFQIESIDFEERNVEYSSCDDVDNTELIRISKTVVVQHPIKNHVSKEANFDDYLRLVIKNDCNNCIAIIDHGDLFEEPISLIFLCACVDKNKTENTVSLSSKP